MRNIYIAAEKLVFWDTSGDIKVDHALAGTLAQMQSDAAYTLYFVPSRFGLCFESLAESEQAWAFFERAIKSEVPLNFRTLCFEDALNETKFRSDMQENTAAQVLLFSSNEADEAMSRTLNIRMVDDIPTWDSDASLRRTMRAILNAALHF